MVEITPTDAKSERAQNFEQVCRTLADEDFVEAITVSDGVCDSFEVSLTVYVSQECELDLLDEFDRIEIDGTSYNFRYSVSDSLPEIPQEVPVYSSIDADWENAEQSKVPVGEGVERLRSLAEGYDGLIYTKQDMADKMQGTFNIDIRNENKGYEESFEGCFIEGYKKGLERAEKNGVVRATEDRHSVNDYENIRGESFIVGYRKALKNVEKSSLEKAKSVLKDIQVEFQKDAPKPRKATEDGITKNYDEDEYTNKTVVEG